jgi:hypothetical protein
MGGAASKVARKLPKRAEAPKWAGVRTPGPTDEPARPHERGASEVKTEGMPLYSNYEPDFYPFNHQLLKGMPTTPNSWPISAS